MLRAGTKKEISISRGRRRGGVDALVLPSLRALEDVPGARRVHLFGKGPPQSEDIELGLLEGTPPTLQRPIEVLVGTPVRRRCLLLCCLLVCCLLLCCVLLCVLCASLLIAEEMGQSVTTPLSLTLDRWKDVREKASNIGAVVHKGEWQTFCAVKWPTFQVGWPEGGSFDNHLIEAVRQKVFAPALRSP